MEVLYSEAIHMFLILGFYFHGTHILYDWLIILSDIESLGYSPYRYIGI